MVNMGKPGVEILDDGWTTITRDGSLSAHFEHTVAITPPMGRYSSPRWIEAAYGVETRPGGKVPCRP